MSIALSLSLGKDNVSREKKQTYLQISIGLG
jgi:hypothetical protein